MPRSSVSDYPEHLNPFYEGDSKFKFWQLGKVKRSSSFGESLRNTLLFKSIRGKKAKEKDAPVSPTLMRKNDASVTPLHRQTLPTINTTNVSLTRNSTPVPLPRSRFSERVAKSNAPTEVADDSPNPFLENGIPKPPVRKYVKRKKKRAPLPPNLDGSLNLSKWSLTSEGTDVSTYSDSEHTIDPEVSMRIAHLTDEIQKMAQDVHEETCDIPDVVVSSIDGIQMDKSQRKSTESSTDENCNVVNDLPLDDETEDAGPDVLQHTNCNECDTAILNSEEASSTESKEDLGKIDSLTNLINSINSDSTDVEQKDFELKEVDSLTNIINSISFTENEAFEGKYITKDYNVEVNGILVNCDNETLDASSDGEIVNEDETLNEKSKSLPVLKEAEEDHLSA